MHKLNVLLLGWEFLPDVTSEQETSCYSLAQALTKQVNLTVLVPQSGPYHTLPQGEITGLDQVNLAEIPALPPSSRPLPYAQEPYIRTDIPLYGATGPHRHSEKLPSQLSNSEIALAQAYSESISSQDQNKVEETVHLFAYKNFQELRLDTQVIEYARYAGRWAAHRSFDIIYAFNYKTYLAATELKLVSGKKLILQVDSFKEEQRPAGSKGWLYELEKQALQQADYILTETEHTSKYLVYRFGLSPDLIKSFEEKTGANSQNLEKEAATTFHTLPLFKKTADPRRTFVQIPIQEELNWHHKAAIIGKVMHQLMSL